MSQDKKKIKKVNLRLLILSPQKEIQLLIYTIVNFIFF